MPQFRMTMMFVGSLMIACAHADSTQVDEPASASQPSQATHETVAEARIEARSGALLTGLARFDLDRGKHVTLNLELANILPGKHAVHLHEFGDCTAPDASSAGEHWNPENAPHGQLDQMPAHLGDIGNVEADADGKAQLKFSTNKWSVGTGMPNDIVGRALVIHEKADDFLSQPSGNAGVRLGCGVVTSTRPAPAVSIAK